MARVDSLDQAAAIFASVRPRIFGIAYRILGSATEAEDVVQDAWLRWQATNRSAVRDPAAFLATTATRLAINSLQSARVRRETYVGEWLPEPIDTSADPALGAERAEAIEIVVLMLLEKLSPAERAAYVLSEAFDYPYAEIAATLQTSEGNARQLASRARKHLHAARREPVSAVEQRRLFDAFLAAAQRGDLAALEQVFSEDVVSYSDGGGFVRAARRPVIGRARVGRFIAKIASWLWDGATLTPLEANGRAAVLIRREGEDHAILTVDGSRQGVDRIFWLMNPAKIAGIARASRSRLRGTTPAVAIRPDCAPT
jgi:RNA polymerase sigma-70 factor (ECF subfamily)